MLQVECLLAIVAPHQKDPHTHFREPDIRRFFPEALTADVQSVLADQTGRVGADTAIIRLLSASASYIETLWLGVQGRLSP